MLRLEGDLLVNEFTNNANGVGSAPLAVNRKAEPAAYQGANT